MAVKKQKWRPLRVITRMGEKYVYVGDIPNNAWAKAENIQFNKECGRKTAFVPDKNDKNVFCLYASSKFYKSMCETQYPTYGKGTLVK
jgi:hypothetical protein